MMKSRKLVVVMILMVTFLSLMVTCVKADDMGLLPTITKGNNQTGNNQAGNNQTSNNVINEPITGNNQTKNNTSNDTNANTDLPQTGVAGNTTLFVFITVCVASAVYAFIRIKKYNDVH